jgi:uncharacterized protein (DUF2141 family)
MQVRDAMRQTASNSCTPNNLVGWGTLNALAAINYNAAATQGSIAGTVFNDVNGNGAWDAGEPGLPGIRVRTACAAAETTYTNGNGSYGFISLRAGSYSVFEDIPPGWTRTLPPGSAYSVSIDSANLHHIAIDFGNFRPGSVAGMKFNDFNHDAVRDTEDPGIRGWVIRLEGPETLRTTTDSLGNYLFTNVGPGLFTVQESSKTDWFQSLPGGDGTYSVQVRSGLDTAGLNFANYFSPAAGYPVFSGWNLLSLPENPSDHSKSALYPVAISRAFAYTPASGYYAIDAIPNGVGYWLKFQVPQYVPIVGDTILTDSIAVTEGWNLVGTVSRAVAISSVVQIPDNILSSTFFTYAGSYVHPDSLRPHAGYFVKARAGGTIVISSTSSSASPGKAAALPPEIGGNASTLSVRNSAGSKEQLFFGGADVLRTEADMFDLPPVPPEDAFDIRFADGSMAWPHRTSDRAQSATILLSGSSYPLTLTWSLASGDRGYTITELKGNEPSNGAPGRTIALNPGGSLTVTDPAVNRLRLEAGNSASAGEIPKEYRLEQNYPNPFNPTTLIAYQIPAAGRVKLEVFNVIGKQVRVLVDRNQPAGSYAAEWEGRSSEGNDLTSGIYFVRLTADGTGGRTFTSIIKTILMR